MNHPVIVAVLVVMVLDLIVIAIAAWEVHFHTRNLRNVMEGRPQREHGLRWKPVCDLLSGRRR